MFKERKGLMYGAAIVAGLGLAGCGIKIEKNAADVNNVNQITPLNDQVLFVKGRGAREFNKNLARIPTGACDIKDIIPISESAGMGFVTFEDGYVVCEKGTLKTELINQADR